MELMSSTHGTGEFHAWNSLGTIEWSADEEHLAVLGQRPEFVVDDEFQFVHVVANLLQERRHGVVIGDGTVDFKADAPVCTDEFGARIEPQPLSSWWTYRRKLFGAEGISLHQLRHTFLSLAAEQGVHPSVMQKLAGHASPNITMKIYTHVNVEAKKAAIEAMQRAYMGKEQKAS